MDRNTLLPLSGDSGLSRRARPNPDDESNPWWEAFREANAIKVRQGYWSTPSQPRGDWVKKVRKTLRDNPDAYTTKQHYALRKAGINDPKFMRNKSVHR